ncbi:T9SS type A sorting domain-containing protein [Ohtaekwangia kribbensis]|uniref:T9SS type A sorting domain-containing protein n=1 Tax=Ohtaekwangia kribbensis TaxID=688913 RepID=A0ABW3K545_9BACT
MKVPAAKLACFILVAFSLLSASASSAQCTIVSTDGYSVTLSVSPVAIVVSSTDCPWGYNYNVTLDYTITFSGSNIPASLYTLQGTVRCNTSSSTTTDMFFDLPNNGGTGSITTGVNPFVNVTGSIAYNYVDIPSCTAATPASLNCLSNNLAIQINGPGIPDQIVSCAQTSLPVKLISFTGKETAAGIQLNWTTATEENFDYFEMERADETLAFNTIATAIAGKGDVNVSASYTYTDHTPVQGKNYYRLKNIDLDGSVEYSDVIMVYTSASDNTIKLYPNPNDRIFTLELQDDMGLPVNLSLVDRLGRDLYQEVISSNTTQIQLPATIETGIYFVKLSSAREQKVLPIVVK